MNKKVTVGIIGTSILLAVLGASQLQPSCISPQPIGRTLPPTQGYSFKIIPPDSDYCQIPYVVLSTSNYTALQNNVGVFTVLDKKPVVASPTLNYCALAKWLYDAHEDTYPEIHAKFKDKMLPPYCSVEINPPKHVQLNEMLTVSDSTQSNIIPIPEFGFVAIVILVIAISSTFIIFGWKKCLT